MQNTVDIAADVTVVIVVDIVVDAAVETAVDAAVDIAVDTVVDFAVEVTAACRESYHVPWTIPWRAVGVTVALPWLLPWACLWLAVTSCAVAFHGHCRADCGGNAGGRPYLATGISVAWLWSCYCVSCTLYEMQHETLKGNQICMASRLFVFHHSRILNASARFALTPALSLRARHPLAPDCDLPYSCCSTTRMASSTSNRASNCAYSLVGCSACRCHIDCIPSSRVLR